MMIKAGYVTHMEDLINTYTILLEIPKERNDLEDLRLDERIILQEVLRRTNLFLLIRHGPHRKRRLQQFLVAVGRDLGIRCLAIIRGHTDRTIDSPSLRHRPYRKRQVQQFFYC
jgi:hypothetical protein